MTDQRKKSPAGMGSDGKTINRETVDGKTSDRKTSIRRKINVLITVIILVVSVSLFVAAYRSFCSEVDQVNGENLVRAAKSASSIIFPYQVEYVWKVVQSEEFQEARARAVAEDDEEILADWMRGQTSWYFAGTGDEEPNEVFNLYEDIQNANTNLTAVKETFDVKAAYVQYMQDGVTYNLMDPDESILELGRVETPIKEFSKYEDNSRIPPTIYHSVYGWLDTAVEPIINPEIGEGSAFGTIGVDIDMTDVMKVRQGFVIHSILFVIVLIAAAILVSTLLMDRMVVIPLRLLADAATGFAKEDRAAAKEDVISLDIDSRDEIGDLYREIRSMEDRIVTNTESLVRMTAEKERVGAELRTAASLQAAMLPAGFPAFPEKTEFDLYASMDPAKEVGGDFYDFFLVDDTHLAVMIADVSDKGVPAALFMMSVKILLAYRAKQGGSPGEILSDVNEELRKNNKKKMFVTVWIGILDLETGMLKCANAGHEYPFLKEADGRFCLLKDRHDLVLGVRAGMRYRDYEIQMHPGDQIFVYTDGVTDANNGGEEFFGMKRLEETMERITDAAPEDVLRIVSRDVNAFTGDTDQFDDMTMLCLEYRGGVSREMPAEAE